MSDSTLPAHPRTGLTALGFRRDGQPIWPILGASEDGGDPSADNGEPPAGGPPADGAPASPDTGDDKDWKVEAEKWKAFARKHEDQAKANADKAKRLDEIEEASKSELDKVTSRAEKAEQELRDAQQRVLRAEVATAKGVPADLLSGTTQEELEASADALLAFRGQQSRPDFGAGNRGDDAQGKKQMSREEVQRLYRERKYDEIEAARTDGRLDGLLSGKA